MIGEKAVRTSAAAASSTNEMIRLHEISRKTGSSILRTGLSIEVDEQIEVTIHRARLTRTDERRELAGLHDSRTGEPRPRRKIGVQVNRSVSEGARLR